MLLVASIATSTANLFGCILALLSCVCYIGEIITQIIVLYELSKKSKEEKKNDKDAD